MPPENFLGLPPSGWSAISSLIAAIGIVGAAVTIFFGFKQLKISRQNLENQTRPYIIVDFESNPAWWQLYDLVIRNIGSSPAYNVAINIDPTPVRAKEEQEIRFARARILNEQTPMIAPGREIRLFFDNMVDRIGTDLPTRYDATVSYCSEAGDKTWTEKHNLDLDLHKGTDQITNYGIHHTAKALREIRKILKDVKDRMPKSGTIHAVTEDRESYSERQRKENEARMRILDEINQQVLPSKDHESDPEEQSD